MTEPRPGDFCCVPLSGPLGLDIEAAQWLTGDKFQPYDHAEIFTGQPDAAGPHGYTVSAYPDRRGRRPLPCPASQLPGSLWSSGIIALTDVQRSAVVSWCLQHQHVAYSALDYGALALHAVHLDVPGLRDFIASSGSMICSQFTDMAYTAAGVRLFRDGRWAGYVKPGDLAGLLQAGHSCR